MLRLCLYWIALMALVAALLFRATAQEETDSTRCRSTLWSPAVGTTLLASGSALTFVPVGNSLAIGLRDAAQADGHSRVNIDDYAQYLPTAVPPVLNICGVKSRHSLKKMALLEGVSYLLGAALLNAGKYGFAVQRPDGTTFNSFPSGHTFVSFTGAEVLRREYGTDYPWLAVAGYTVAAVIGALRVYNNRHWVGDVLAGAGLGILSVGVVYTLFD